MKFIGFPADKPRRAFVVGDVVNLQPETPSNVAYPVLVTTTVTQPSGSAVTWTAGLSTVLVQPGYYLANVVSGGQATQLELVVFPAAALNINAIQFMDVNRSATRQDSERRDVLQAIVRHAPSVAGIQAALEGGAAVAPMYGITATLLGMTTAPYLGQYGATIGL